MCGVEIRVRDETILSIRGDEKDPFSRGHICPKALGIKDVHEDPDRIRHPMRRTATGWEAISWDEAFDEVARRLVSIQREHGMDAVASYIGNPQVHSYSGLLGGARFLRTLRSRNRYSATSVDQLPHHFVAYFMYGHQLMIPVPDLDRTSFFLVLGGNPVVSNGSLMTAPDVARRLKDLRARGGRLVVVDPRRTETADLADTHLFIRPGTDALFLLSILHVLFKEGRISTGTLDHSLTGLDIVRDDRIVDRARSEHRGSTGPRLFCGIVGGVLRPNGRLDSAFRRALPMAHSAHQYLHRKSGSNRWSDVHATRLRCS
jgi:anaerobic selenocysteine-containing dehydrogenase